MNALISWFAGGERRTARWSSEAGLAAPAAVDGVDDSISAERAFRRMAAGEWLLWQGDWVNGRHLLQAITRRADRWFAGNPLKAARTPAEGFARHRQRQGERAGLLARWLVPLDGHYEVPLHRAQPTQAACEAAWGAADGQDRVLPLRELLAVISAYEWQKKGVPVPALGGGRIHPAYGVFSPVRGEYVDLVATAPLPAKRETAVDVGAGSGVLAALLAQRGFKKVIATEVDARALRCAEANMARLGWADTVDVRQTDLFPPETADLIVCNPPWLPAEPSSPVERAVYDPDSQMLRRFLAGVADHLAPAGEAWLILSDLAEHLGLRTRDALLGWMAAGGLTVVERRDVPPRHGKAQDPRDPLHIARSREVTSLWRLKALPR